MGRVWARARPAISTLSRNDGLGCSVAAGYRPSMRLETIGAWCAAFTVASAEAARPAAREIEGLGYETLSHNQEVYSGLLGLSDAELGRLREDGVV